VNAGKIDATREPIPHIIFDNVPSGRRSGLSMFNPGFSPGNRFHVLIKTGEFGAELWLANRQWFSPLPTALLPQEEEKYAVKKSNHD
jgi:hypothetical protein